MEREWDQARDSALQGSRSWHDLGRLKAARLVRAVAERTLLSGSATAECDVLFAGQVVFVAEMVAKRDRAADEQWTVLASLDRDVGHVGSLQFQKDEFARHVSPAR